MSKYLFLWSTMFLAFIAFSIIGACKSYPQNSSKSVPVSHDLWTQLLQKYVSPTGNVNYKGFIEEKETLDQYLQLLQANYPNNNNWSKAEQLAYWLNAYNAFTVALIIENYPVKSIKDITKGPNIPFVNSPWDIKFINIEGVVYDLNNIEHSILRKKFNEPRIHFAINCASKSCPNLLPEAFTSDKLEEQLTALARLFLSDTTKNIIQTDSVQLSKIFSWFKGDFTKNGKTLIQFLNQYAPVAIQEDAEILFLDYDWQLNE